MITKVFRTYKTNYLPNKNYFRDHGGFGPRERTRLGFPRAGGGRGQSGVKPAAKAEGAARANPDGAFDLAMFAVRGTASDAT